ncbi:unnamed protein product [Somion occarium]|uniref:HMG box domain-containing protein n=1 Tax=Somion occarium TaxID=3059160 RepID=A0ABP1CLY5_9APHY
MPLDRHPRRSRRTAGGPLRRVDLQEDSNFDIMDLICPPTPDSSAHSPSNSSAASSPSSDTYGSASPSLSDNESLPSPQTRKKQGEHVPRPPNAFLIFRSFFWLEEKIKATAERDHRQISRLAGIRWKQLSEAEKEPYKIRADAVKNAHKAAHPGYKYAPCKVKSSKKKVSGSKTVAELLLLGMVEDEIEREVARRPRVKVEERRIPIVKTKPRPKRQTKKHSFASEGEHSAGSSSAESSPSSGFSSDELRTPDLTFSKTISDDIDIARSPEVSNLDICNVLQEMTLTKSSPTIVPTESLPHVTEPMFPFLKPQASALAQSMMLTEAAILSPSWSQLPMAGVELSPPSSSSLGLAVPAPASVPLELNLLTLPLYGPDFTSCFVTEPSFLANGNNEDFYSYGLAHSPLVPSDVSALDDDIFAEWLNEGVLNGTE